MITNNYNLEIIGHRGCRAYLPENSIPAVEHAILAGVDYVDIDVNLTQDHVLIAYHDNIINPDIICDTNYHYLANSKNDLLENYSEQELKQFVIKNYTMEQIKKNYFIQLNPNSPYAKYFPQQQQVKNLSLVSLQEIIDYCNSRGYVVKYQIEIKYNFDYPQWCLNYEDLVNAMYKFIKMNNLFTSIKVQSFDWRILHALNTLDPRIKTAYLVNYITLTKWQSWFKDSFILDVAKQIGVNLNKETTDVIDLIKLFKTFGGYSFEPEDNELTYEQIKYAHELGLKVYVWCLPEHSGFTLNYALVDKLIQWGVNGIINDHPNEIIKYLNR